MEVFLERLLVELVVIGVQLAVWRLLAWISQELAPRSDGVRFSAVA
ncbi:MAG: hypothetical protein M0Z69_09960 [Actinomycetota bacterium]|nr:hypothetical protein [Actinomycetota bacterium]